MLEITVTEGYLMELDVSIQTFEFTMDVPISTRRTVNTWIVAALQ